MNILEPSDKLRSGAKMVGRNLRWWQAFHKDIARQGATVTPRKWCKLELEEWHNHGWTGCIPLRITVAGRTFYALLAWGNRVPVDGGNEKHYEVSLFLCLRPLAAQEGYVSYGIRKYALNKPPLRACVLDWMLWQKGESW